MIHLTKLPSMKERIHILQVQFLLWLTILPKNTLLAKLLPHIQAAQSDSQWDKIAKILLWLQCVPQFDSLTTNKFISVSYFFLRGNFLKRISGQSAKILSQCRLDIGIGLIFWLPMTRQERDRCLRTMFNWLPGEKPKPFPYYPNHLFTKQCSICRL